MKNNKGFGITELLLGGVGVALVLGLFIGMALWTGRSLDWVLSEWKHHSVHVPFWIAFLVSLIGNAVVFAFNVIVELLRFVK